MLFITVVIGQSTRRPVCVCDNTRRRCRRFITLQQNLSPVFIARSV